MDFTNAIHGSGGGGGGGGGAPTKRRIMVVVDPGREAAAALQWTLSHAVLEQDDLILLHVEQIGSSLRKANTISTYFRKASTSSSSSSSGNNNGHMGATGSASFGPSPSIWTSKSTSVVESEDFLEGMRAQCEAAQPRVRVQIERVEMVGKDKAAAILAQSKLHGVHMLVIGQPRRTSSLFSKLGGGTASKDCTAEFLIENSKSLCVGVQKKGQNAGYLLNTKTHKNFWLLA